MVYGHFKYLSGRIAAGTVLRDKTLKNAINAKYDGYQRDLSSLVYRFIDKKFASGDAGGAVKNEFIQK